MQRDDRRAEDDRGQHGPLPGGDDDRRPVTPLEDDEVARQAGQRAQRGHPRAAEAQRPRAQRRDGPAARAARLGQRPLGTRQHDRAVQRPAPVQQDPFRAAEHARVGDQQDGPGRRRASDRRCRGRAGARVPRAAERGQLGSWARGVASEQRVARGAGREGQRLGGIVGAEGGGASGGGDRLAPAAGQQLVGLAGAERGVAADVAHAQPRVQHGRHADGARPEAQLHVLGEQVDGRVERARGGAAAPSTRQGTPRSPSRRFAAPRRGAARAGRAGTTAAAARARALRRRRPRCPAADARSAGRRRRGPAAAGHAERPDGPVPPRRGPTASRRAARSRG